MGINDDDDKTTPFIRDEEDGKPAVDPYRSLGTPKVTVGPNSFGKNFNDAKNRRAPKWAGPLLTGAVLFHAVLFMTMWVKSIWEIEMLERPKTQVDLAVAPPPPPP